MILDAKLVFSDGQEETTAAAHDSDNIVDTETTSNLAIGTELIINVVVSTTFTSGGSATLIATFQTSPDNSSWTTHCTSETWAVADLAAGAVLLRRAIPMEKCQRYWKFVYTIGTAAMTAGAVDAFITIK